MEPGSASRCVARKSSTAHALLLHMRTLRSSTTRYTVLKARTMIDLGNDLKQYYVSCGPGFDTVNQGPPRGAARRYSERLRSGGSVKALYRTGRKNTNPPIPQGRLLRLRELLTSRGWFSRESLMHGPLAGGPGAKRRVRYGCSGGRGPRGSAWECPPAKRSSRTP